MAFLGQSYEESELPKGGGGFDPLPAGWYTANITKSEVKATKAGDGSYIAVGYTITGPTHEGRVIFGNLNIRNKNPKAEEIGRQQLGDVMRAIGLAKVDDSDQLIGGTLSIKLKIKPADGQYEASNEVVAWKAVEGSAPPAAKASGGSNGGGGKPPWAK